MKLMRTSETTNTWRSSMHTNRKEKHWVNKDNTYKKGHTRTLCLPLLSRIEELLVVVREMPPFWGVRHPPESCHPAPEGTAFLRPHDYYSHTILTYSYYIHTYTYFTSSNFSLRLNFRRLRFAQSPRNLASTSCTLLPPPIKVKIF